MKFHCSHTVCSSHDHCQAGTKTTSVDLRFPGESRYLLPWSLLPSGCCCQAINRGEVTFWYTSPFCRDKGRPISNNILPTTSNESPPTSGFSSSMKLYRCSVLASRNLMRPTRTTSTGRHGHDDEISPDGSGNKSLSSAAQSNPILPKINPGYPSIYQPVPNILPECNIKPASRNAWNILVFFHAGVHAAQEKLGIWIY